MKLLLKQRGFTIVELLIVIVIIAILAGLVIVTYSGLQRKAQASALITGFRAIDKGLRAFAVDSGRQTWWTDNSTSLTGSANPDIPDIIAATDLKLYLQKVPVVSGLESGYWWYDHDDDTYSLSGCTAATSGANIVFSRVSRTVAQAVDKAIDDDNVLCGKVRYNSSAVNGDRLFYLLSENAQL